MHFICATCSALLLQGEMKKAVFAYWDGGYLDRSDEGSYGYGMVGVLKPDGSARVCGDYRPAIDVFADKEYTFHFFLLSWMLLMIM